MTDKLTPTQTLLVWCLLAKQGIARQADIMPAPKAADRKVLETARFVSVTKQARSMWIKLEDKGWGWAADHLRDPLPPAHGALHGLMTRLHEYLAKTDEGLGDFIGAALEPAISEPPGAPKKARKRAVDSTVPRGTKPKRADVRKEIERAYLEVTGKRKGVEARLSELRPRLSHLDRRIVDEGLAAMRRSDAKARLMRIDDQRSITSADAEAALHFAGEDLHILWIMK